MCVAECSVTGCGDQRIIESVLGGDFRAFAEFYEIICTLSCIGVCIMEHLKKIGEAKYTVR